MRQFALISLLAGAACAGNGIEGTVDGQTLVGTSTIVGKFSDETTDGTAVTVTTLLISNAVAPCQMIRDNKNQKNTSGLSIFLGKKVGASRQPATEAGAYIVAPEGSLPDGNFALVYAVKLDESCVNVIAGSKIEAVQGKVVVEAIQESGPASGTFDLEFAGGDKVTGEFTAGFCDAQPAAEEATCG